MTKNSADAADERYPMTYTEQSTWWTLILIPLAAVVYFAVVVPQLAHTPASEVSWQVPMIIAIAAAIVGVMVGTIGGVVVSAVRRREAEDESDVREQQIERHGDRLSARIASTGAAGILVLAMLGVDQFWIGNAIFALGVVGSIIGSLAKLGAYRGVFRG